jgi:hypothetical protein
VNGINGTDVLAILGMISGLGSPLCVANVDTNCSGAPDGRDILAILLYMAHANALPVPSNCRAIGT